MLNFIIGVKNSGKTRKCHEILGRSILKGKGAMIIVPKQFTFETDRGILSLLGPKTACEIDVLSFSRLCHVAVSHFGGIKQPVASSGMREIYMSLAIDGLKDKLTFFARHKNEIAFTQKMLKEYDSLKKNGITHENLCEVSDKVSDNLLKAKLKESALIFSTYEAIVSQSHFDDGDLLNKVYEILVGTDFFKDKTIVIDGFKSFTQPELRLIELMLKGGDEVYVSLTTDDIMGTDDMGVFSFVNATARRLRSIAGNANVPMGEIIKLERDESKFSEEMLFLERNIYQNEYSIYNAETDKVGIIEAQSVEDECDAVSRQIKALIRQGKYRMRDIVVVFRESGKYEQCIKRSLRKYALPIFEDKRQPIKNQPLIAYVRSLLSIVSEGFNSEYIFRLIKTGLCFLDENEIAEIENYVFTWDITGKKWLEDFSGDPDGFGSERTERSNERLDAINETRRKIIQPLKDLRESLQGESGKNVAEKIYYYLRQSKTDEALKDYAISLQDENLNELAIEQEQVWDMLMEILSEIAEVLGDTVVPLKRFCELFDLVSAGKSLGKLPDGYDEVYVCDAERVLTKSAKVVFALGMNNGVFPLEQKGEGLFSSSEKKKIALLGTELGDDIKDMLLRERFICYSTLSSSEDILYLSYSTCVGTEKLSAGECVQEIIKLFPNCKKIGTSLQKIYDLVESEESAFELMAKRWTNDDDEIASLKEYFKSKEDYKGKLDALQRAVSDKDFAFKDNKISTSLFGKDMYFSASQLEVYYKCPFMYFCRYGIKAKPRPKAELDAAIGGNVVHYVLENILKSHKGKEFLSLSSQQLDEEIREYLLQYIRKYMSDVNDVSERFTYLYTRLYKVLRHLLKRLTAEFDDSDFEPWDFELAIGNKEKVKPFSVDLDEGSVKLIGKIDRVDKMDLAGKRYIRIVDYKTGIKEFNLSDVFYGINMQMLLYLISIWRGGTDCYEDITPAGILYFPARLSPCDVERNDDEETKIRKSMLTGKMSGMLVYDPNSTAAMDKSRKAIFVPVKYTKGSDEPTGNFITLGQLEKLGEMLDNMIKNMGDRLHEGLVEARPIYGKGHGETCEWCDYKDVCLKDKPAIRYAEKMTHDQCIRKLMGGEDNG